MSLGNLKQFLRNVFNECSYNQICDMTNASLSSGKFESAVQAIFVEWSSGSFKKENISAIISVFAKIVEKHLNENNDCVLHDVPSIEFYSENPNDLSTFPNSVIKQYDPSDISRELLLCLLTVRPLNKSQVMKTIKLKFDAEEINWENYYLISEILNLVLCPVEYMKLMSDDFQH